MPSDTPRPDFDRPQATKIVCRVFEGFANRLNGIASALSTGRPVSIQWAINDHCPASFEDCFRPLDGVEVANESALAYPHSVSPQKLCWFYPKNVDELPYGRFRSRMMASYDYLLSRIAVTDWACPAAPALGCHYRHYLAKPDSFSRYCGWIRCAVSQLSPATVHVASDSADHKSQLLALLADLQVPTTHNDAPLLDHDLDRRRWSAGSSRATKS